MKAFVPAEHRATCDHNHTVQSRAKIQRYTDRRFKCASLAWCRTWARLQRYELEDKLVNRAVWQTCAPDVRTFPLIAAYRVNRNARLHGVQKQITEQLEDMMHTRMDDAKSVAWIKWAVDSGTHFRVARISDGEWSAGVTLQPNGVLDEKNRQPSQCKGTLVKVASWLAERMAQRMFKKHEQGMTDYMWQWMAEEDVGSFTLTEYNVHTCDGYPAFVAIRHHMVEGGCRGIVPLVDGEVDVDHLSVVGSAKADVYTSMIQPLVEHGATLWRAIRAVYEGHPTTHHVARWDVVWNDETKAWYTGGDGGMNAHGCWPYASMMDTYISMASAAHTDMHTSLNVLQHIRNPNRKNELNMLPPSWRTVQHAPWQPAHTRRSERVEECIEECIEAPITLGKRLHSEM
jgi:hypothetical protein